MFTFGDQLSRHLGQGLADNWSQVSDSDVAFVFCSRVSLCTFCLFFNLDSFILIKVGKDYEMVCYLFFKNFYYYFHIGFKIFPICDSLPVVFLIAIKKVKEEHIIVVFTLHVKCSVHCSFFW